MIKIGIIGYGYWGPNLVRNFSGIDKCSVEKVADKRQERQALLARNYPSVKGTLSADDIINDPAIDAIAVATPVFTHFEIARRALEAGKHVLIEKPMTSTSDQAKKLIELAGKKGLVLMVDHTFCIQGQCKKSKN